MHEAFQFDQFQDYFAAASQRSLANGRRKMTLAEWAKKLGYRSPRTIGMVLSGERLPSAELISRLSSVAELTDAEHRYFELLVELQRRQRKGKPVSDLVRQLKRFKGHTSDRVVLSADTFNYISDWYFCAIKQLLESPGAKADPAWIRTKLKGKVSLKEILEALQTMRRLGILVVGANGRLKSSGESLTIETDVPAEAGRNHHIQMMDRAREALQEQPVERREFDSKTFRMDPKRIKEAKKALRNFRDGFIAEFFDEESKHVFQINSQLFEHTEEL